MRPQQQHRRNLTTIIFRRKTFRSSQLSGRDVSDDSGFLVVQRESYTAQARPSFV